MNKSRVRTNFALVVFLLLSSFTTAFLAILTTHEPKNNRSIKYGTTTPTIGPQSDDRYINIVAPFGGQFMWVGDTVRIRWQSQDVRGVDIYLCEGEDIVHTIVESYRFLDSYWWEVIDIQKDSGRYRILIVDEWDPRVWDISEYFYIFNRDDREDPEPSISVKEPSSQAVWEAGNEYEISWETTGEVSEIDILLLEEDEERLTVVKKTSNDGSFFL